MHDDYRYQRLNSGLDTIVDGRMGRCLAEYEGIQHVMKKHHNSIHKRIGFLYYTQKKPKLYLSHGA